MHCYNILYPVYFYISPIVLRMFFIVFFFLKPESNQGSYFTFSCYENDNFS